MYGDDDRVKTLLEQINMQKNLIPYEFDDNFNYLQNINYNNYDIKLSDLKIKSIKFLKDNLSEDKDENN